MKLFDKTWKLALSGVVIGLLVMLLAMSGNPANMAICVACFIRDAAGALKLHTAAPVQYFRPEIVGFVCWFCADGAFSAGCRYDDRCTGLSGLPAAHGATDVCR